MIDSPHQRRDLLLLFLAGPLWRSLSEKEHQCKKRKIVERHSPIFLARSGATHNSNYTPLTSCFTDIVGLVRAL